MPYERFSNREQKNAASKAAFLHPVLSGLRRHFLDALAQPALVPGSLVLVDDSLVDHGVDDRDGCLVRGLRRFLVTGLAGLDDILDLGAHARAQAHVVLAGLLRLPGALLCRLDISHCFFRVLLSKSRVLFAAGTGMSTPESDPSPERAPMPKCLIP